jgi:hypothetical protein
MVFPNPDNDGLVKYQLPLVMSMRLLTLCSGLMSDNKPLLIRTQTSGTMLHFRDYYIQKTLLASVSVKLAQVPNCCSNSYHCHRDIGDEAFRIFLCWLLREDINKNQPSQVVLAQAWNFGAGFEIPTFQDIVMRLVVARIGSETVEAGAVVEAYKGTERGTLLQRAFVGQLAIDMNHNPSYEWTRADFKDFGLDRVPDLCLDLIDAMSRMAQGFFPDGDSPTIELKDFLLLDEEE